MSRPAGSDRAEEEYSSALFLSGAAAGRYSSDALPTGIVARTAAACRKSVGRRRRGKAARRAGTTGSRRVSVACGIGDGRSSIRHGLSPNSDRCRGRCGPPAVESGWRQRLLFFLADLPFVACGQDRSGCDRMKSAARDSGLPNAARYADAGRTLKKDGPAREPLNLTCRSYYCWLRMRIAASRIVVSSSVTTPPSGPCSTWMPTFPLAS